MPRIAIVTPHLTTADAIGNDVLGMHDVLKSRGYDVRIYAADWAIGQTNPSTLLKIKSLLVKPLVWPVSKIKSFLKHPKDLLIYHYSMGWRTGCDLLSELRCRKVIKYHNITPPHFFSDWSEEYETVCRIGRNEMSDIVKAKCDVYLSASSYNMSELISAGAPRSKSFVVPPFHRIDNLFSIEPDFNVLDTYRNGTVNLLMVGTLVPNKGHIRLLEIFFTYHQIYNRNSRLLIVGKERANLRRYNDFLRIAINRLALQDKAVLLGEVTDNALKSYYLLADVFVMASEHEGFCVPLVESMAMKVPIVAINSSAIPETVSTAGLVWDEYQPYLFAESIDTVIKDDDVRSALGLIGRERYNQFFTQKHIEQQFLHALDQVL